MTFGGLFRRDGEWIVPTEYARGPWNPNTLHGGPVAALIALAIESHLPLDLPPFVARLTVELLRPVPLAALKVETSTRRPGRKVAWVDAVVCDEGGVEVAAARALRIHRLDPPLDVGDSADPAVPMLRLPDEIQPDVIGVGDQIGFWSASDFRLAAGDWQAAGPGAAWFRLRVPVVEGEATSPLARVVAAADFGSGVGNPVRNSTNSTINAELTVHVHRHAIGEWIGLESMAWAHGDGGGLCETRLFDTTGTLGRGTQALLVQDFNPFRMPPQPHP
jgi:hypothetical protein